MEDQVQIEVCRVADYAPIDKLRFHPENPRAIKPERLDDLKASIIRKGFYQPILVWKKYGVVLAGNHRLLAAQELVKEGYTFVAGDKQQVLPVVYEDCSKERALEILFESNNNYADWVEEKVRLALKEAEENGVDLRDYGFTQDYVDKLLKDAIKDAEDLTVDDDLEEPDDAEERATKEEEFETLVLERPAYSVLLSLLQEVSRLRVKDWEDGDSLSDGIFYLCQFSKEKGILEPSKKSKK